MTTSMEFIRPSFLYPVILPPESPPSLPRSTHNCLRDYLTLQDRSDYCMSIPSVDHVDGQQALLENVLGAGAAYRFVALHRRLLLIHNSIILSTSSINYMELIEY